MKTLINRVFEAISLIVEVAAILAGDLFYLYIMKIAIFSIKINGINGFFGAYGSIMLIVVGILWIIASMFALNKMDDWFRRLAKKIRNKNNEETIDNDNSL